MKQFINLHKLLQEGHFRLREHNCYRTIHCLGIDDEEKVHSDFSCTLAWCCIAHLGQVPYPEYNSWVFEFGYLLKWSKRRKCHLQPSKITLDVLLYIGVWKCFLDESTDCSEIQQCEGEYYVKMSYWECMLWISWLHEAINRTWSLKLAVQAGFCFDSGVLCLLANQA